MIFILTPNTTPYGCLMKKISAMIVMLFIYMLSASTPAYAATDAKTVAEDTAKVATTDKKETTEDEEPDCD